MKYSKSDGAYFRKSKKENSIKGGKLKEDEKLENSDFVGKNGNNVVPKQEFKMKQKNGSFELRNLNQNRVDMPINRENPIKIMIQKKTQRPFVFFAYNTDTNTYDFVCYINPNASNLNNNLIICKKLVIHQNSSSEIADVPHMQFLNIDIEVLIVLYYNLLKIREKHPEFMNKLFEYLQMFVFGCESLNIQNNTYLNNTYRSMVVEINKMLRDEEIYKQNRMETQKIKNQIKIQKRSVKIV